MWAFVAPHHSELCLVRWRYWALDFGDERSLEVATELPVVADGAWHRVFAVVRQAPD
jgi:hypothetical protein